MFFAILLLAHTCTFKNCLRDRNINNIKNWPLDARKPDFAAYEQQMRRSDCAYAKSDQRFCCSLSVKHNDSTSFTQNLNILASLCSRTDLIESHLVANPEDRVSHVKRSRNVN